MAELKCEFISFLSFFPPETNTKKLISSQRQILGDTIIRELTSLGLLGILRGYIK